MVPSKCSCTKVKDGNSRTNRYKGVENLLRRIAFNLGNTPSKTEVKVISCIPIDVTDLQQKIICLERQLEKTQCDSKKCAPVIVNRVGADSTKPNTRQSQVQLFDSPTYYPRRHKHTPDLSRYSQDPAQYRPKKTESRNVFGRVIPEKERTRLVYYAQTAGSPFTYYKKANDTSKENSDEPMDREYLSSLVERQHMVKMYMDDDMLGSQGSVPVCRDVPRCSGTSDDMCSCCHGNFLDVDCKIRKRPFYDPNIDHGNIYYDSSLYDVKPVKEKPVKNGNQIRKDMTFLPEYYRFKPEYCLNMVPMPHNHCSTKPIQKRERRAKPVFLPNDSSATDGLVEFSHVYPKRLSPKQELRHNTNNVSRNAECTARSDNTEFHLRPSKPIQTLHSTNLISTSNNLSQSGNAECSQAIDNSKCLIGHMKALKTSLSKFGSTHNGIKATSKNAACLAHPVNEIECQTDPLKDLQSDSTSPPDKTESTLNQIKTMLETVLVEVKTNSGVRTIVSEKETKDATVQNENGPTSECERLLNSITYSPYAMLNPYMASCSRTLPSYCSSMMRQTLTTPRHEVPPPDYVPNFPEMVHQTVAAHSCFPDRNAMQPKLTSTCGTNTLHEPPKRRNTETEDLIKEIYKSIKLDVDYPLKSRSRDIIHDSKALDVCKKPETKTTLGREEIVFRGDVGTSRAARLGSPSSHSSLTRPHRRGSLHQQPKHTTSAQRRQCISKGTNKDSHTSDSDSESDDVVQPSASPGKTASIPAKKGFFGKVMSSVVKKMRKKEEQPQPLGMRTTAATQDSESSDFETPIVPKERPVKHVSYAPAAETWREGSPRPMITSSKTRRLGQTAYRRPERPGHQNQRMPRYVPPRPRSVLRPHAGSSQIRRTIYRPQPPNRPRTPPEYMKRVPHNQYDWRTTPTRSVHRMAPTNDYKPRIPTKSPGLKITNKTWMRKPVYHLGFACGPEKEKIMMNY
ncbi:uncharacterized protein LOC133521046 [Cydia pomonella]|uniref:uncharacterized protein LOC133521046 n=1 Tax=Cydia pomonella TaxID=82600 RepID=UPI002ADDA4A4|nr:uncharacterized protein LOC133521046 [Cydia pomonella]